MNDPTDEEMAVIIAAVAIVWPEPAPADAPSDGPNRWRFSGRWWSRPSVARRERPWLR